MRKKAYLLFMFSILSSLAFGQIFITEIADPFDDERARYVELFNNGDTNIDLSVNGKYGLQRYSENKTTPESTIYKLTGIIPAKSTYVVAQNTAEFFTVFGFVPDQEIG